MQKTIMSAGAASAWLTVSTAVAALLGGIVGSWLDFDVRDRQLDVRLVEIAVGILQAEPKDNIRPAREWAVDVIAKYSNVPISPASRVALIDNSLKIWNLKAVKAGDFGMIYDDAWQKLKRPTE